MNYYGRQVLLMASRRIYITLNSEKEKDRVIDKYLSSCYSEKDAIKEALYRLAIKDTATVQKGAKSTDKVQNGTKCTETVKKKSAPKRSKKYRNGGNNTKEEQNSKTENMQKYDAVIDLKDIDDGYVPVKKEPELKKNELEQLQKFM